MLQGKIIEELILYNHRYSHCDIGLVFWTELPCLSLSSKPWTTSLV